MSVKGIRTTINKTKQRILQPLLAPVRKRWRGWIQRRHQPVVDEIVLDHRTVYILPTGQGCLFGFMLLGLLLAGLNYSNNIVLALCFGLAAVALVSLYHTQMNLRGIVVAVRPGTERFCGQSVSWQLVFHADSPRRGLLLEVLEPAYADTARTAWLDIEGDTELPLILPSQQRGYIQLPALRLSSRYPLGLCRAWTYCRFQAPILIYPQPAEQACELVATDERIDQSAASMQPGEDEFAGLRDYQAGDAPGRIDWRALARERGVLVRQYQHNAGADRWLDWQQLVAQAPQQDPEILLSRLTRAILELDAAGQCYGLRLPHHEFSPGRGQAHQRRCLQALALFSHGS